MKNWNLSMIYYAALKQNTSVSLPYKDTFCSPEFQFDFTFFSFLSDQRFTEVN